MEKYTYLASICESFDNYAAVLGNNRTVAPGDMLIADLPNQGLRLCKVKAVTFLSADSDDYKLIETLCPILPESSVTAIYRREEVTHEHS